MKQFIAGLVFLLLGTSLTAQQVTFGELFPLTNTRYGVATTSRGSLVTNGRDFFLFWESPGGIRATKLVEGERRGGRIVLEVDDNADLGAEVIWTGTHFLIVRATGDAMVGRLLDANADPAGAPFPILDSTSSMPRLASNGRRIVMLYRNGHQLRTVTLGMDGRPVGATRELLPPIPFEGLTDFDVATNGIGFAATVGTEHAVRVYTFDGDGQQATERLLFSDLNNYIHYVAAGTDGRDYIAAWASIQGGAAIALGADGVTGAAIAFELTPGQNTSFSSDVDVTWTGSTYALAYVAGDPRTLRVAHLDGLVLRFLGHEQTTGLQPSIATAGGVTRLSWLPLAARGPVSVAALPLSGSTPAVVTHAAAEQVLLSTTGAFDTTLTVWRETADGQTTVRAGLRERNGEWSERQLAETSGNARAVAASNGREYVVAVTDTSARAYLLDVRGRAIDTVPLPFEPSSIVWNGTHYLVGAMHSAEVLTLTPSGTLSAPVTLAAAGMDTSLTTDGVNTVAAWIDVPPCPVLCPAGGEVMISRLGANLQRLDSANLLTGSHPAIDVTAAWDGARFVVAWSGGSSVSYTRVNPSGPTAPVVVVLMQGILAESYLVQAAPVAGAVALVWSERVVGFEPKHHLALLGSDASVRMHHFDAHRQNGFARVSAGPDGRIILATYGARPDAPHHGSDRVLMSVGRVDPIQPPDAPSLDADIRNGRIHLTWSPPPQPFGGYRVEYKIGDGSWHELEPWYDPEMTGTPLQFPIRRGIEYQFRIRAWNDAGPSAYSAVARWSAPKRRAVR